MNTSSPPDPHNIKPTAFDREREQLRKDRPPWIDEEAVESFVEYIIFLPDEEDQQRHDGAYDNIMAALSQTPTPEQLDRRVCAEARRGNFEPLAGRIQLLASKPGTGARRSVTLSKEAWDLILDRLPLSKPKRGRPPKTEEERRTATPAHVAAEIVPGIQLILQYHYPEKSPKDIRERAVRKGRATRPK